MKRLFTITFIAFCFSLFVHVHVVGAVSLSSFFSGTNVNATYTPLVVIPGLTDAQTTSQGLGAYLLNAYIWIIFSSITLAIVMFTIHAFQYLVSEVNVASISKAKTGMWNSIIGLLIVLGAYLILQTINPALTHLNISLTGTVPPNPQTATTYAGGATSCLAAQNANNKDLPFDQPGVYIEEIDDLNTKGQITSDKVPCLSYAWVSYPGTIQACQSRVDGQQAQSQTDASANVGVTYKQCDVVTDPTVPLPACVDQTPKTAGTYIQTQGSSCQGPSGQSIQYNYTPYAGGLETCWDSDAGQAQGAHCQRWGTDYVIVLSGSGAKANIPGANTSYTDPNTCANEVAAIVLDPSNPYPGQQLSCQPVTTMKAN